MAKRVAEMSPTRGVSAPGSVLRPDEASGLLYNFYLLATACCAVITIAVILRQDATGVLLSGVSTVAFCALLLLVKRGAVVLAGALGTGYLIALIVTAMVIGNGIRDLSMPVFGFVVLLANLVLNERMARTVTLVAWCAVVSTALAEYLRWFTTPLSFRTTLTSVVVVALVHLAVALTARRLVRAFHEGIRRAHLQELSYGHIFNATGEAIFLIDPKSERIIDANQSAQTMFGFGREELLRTSFLKLAATDESVEQVADMRASRGCSIGRCRPRMPQNYPSK